jgi:DNA (cytosine-5)-methyltransferase 1
MFRLLELCAGYGSQALALKNLGLDVYSEIAEFDKYASQAYMQLHGDTKNYGDIYTIDETKLPYFDMITYSTPCFTEDSLVLTEKRGFQKIIDIQIGEKVITHDGNYKTVENVINNGKKKTVKIYGMGIDEIHTTPNHLFYVREKSHVWNNKTRSYTRVFSEPVWKQADSLKRTDYMGIPINKKSEIPEWNGITFVWSDGRKDRYKNQLSQYMNNKDFWWLIGRYIADGWFRNNGGIIIGCGKKKFVEMKEKCDSIGLNYNILEERTVIKFYYQLKELELFVQSFGKYAYGKKIPSFVMDLPVDLLNSFLNGYMSGDGCFTNGRFKATSVSRELIYGLAQCIAKVYKQPYSIYKTERPKTTVIEGRTVNQKDTYELCFKKEKRPQDKAFYEDGFIWFPVTKVEEDEIETVYDLTVEENHSFTVQGVIVHNCQDFSVAGKGKGGDKGSGTRSSLLWECERIIRAVKPKYLLMENVKNLLSKKHCHNFNAWIKVLEDMGYTNYYKVLNAKDYGIPQNRERIFVVSICKDIDKKGYVFPNPVPLELRLRDVLEENVPEKYYLSADKVAKLLKSVDVNKYKINEPLALDEQNNYIRKDGRVGTIMTDGSSSKHNNRVIFPLFIKEATKKGYAEAYEYDSITLDQPNSKTRRGRVGKQISNTLTCSCNMGVIESYRIRKLTARECFRLMGVKDEQFDRLNGISNSQLYKLAGNSIVVDVLEAIFKNLLMPETTDTKGQLSLF